MTAKRKIPARLKKAISRKIVAVGDQGLVWRFMPNNIPGLRNMIPVFVPIKDRARRRRP